MKVALQRRATAIDAQMIQIEISKNTYNKGRAESKQKATVFK